MAFYMQDALQIILVLFWLLSAHQVAAQDTSSSLTILEGHRARYNLPGLVAGVVGDDRSLKAQAVGVRKEGDSTEMTVQDDFHLGSNTKAMTATLLAVLIEQGLFSWDTTLWDALPEWRASMHKAHRNTTLAMLTAHRTGIPKDAGDMAVSNTTLLSSVYDWDGPVGRGEVMAFILPQPPIHAPNTTFLYSNLNYVIAGTIIDKRAGPWETVIREKLWRPLNMTNCGFGPAPQSNATAVENPWPHSRNGTTPVPETPSPRADNPPYFGPAGTVHCSALSYSRFLAAHLDGLAGRDTRVLRAASFVALHTAHRAADEQYTRGGWFTTRGVAGARLSHTGTNMLNYASAVLASGRDEAYVAFTNVGGTGAGEALDDVMRDLVGRELDLTQTVVWDRLPLGDDAERRDEATQTGTGAAAGSTSAAQTVRDLRGAGVTGVLSGLLCVWRVVS